MRKVFVEFLQSKDLPSGWLPDYWLMLTVAIISASLLTIVLWRRRGQPSSLASDLIFWGILGLFVRAKFFFFLQFGFPPSLSGWFSTGGIALYGGLAGVLTALGGRYLLRPYPLAAFLDCAAPALALGLCLGRVGCFLAGCNGGLPSDLPWAVRFPRGTAVFFHQKQAGLVQEFDKLALPAHPTQMYESLFALVAFVLLLILLKHKQWHGLVFLAGILWYAIYRFATEPLRADTGGLHPFGILTFSQFVSVVLAVASVGGLIYFSMNVAGSSDRAVTVRKRDSVEESSDSPRSDASAATSQLVDRS